MEKDEAQSNAQEEDTSKTTVISEQVVVIEREFKSHASHSALITGIQNLNEQEFLTCGIDKALKVWDNESEACDYTIETHETLNVMAITGERMDMLIASLGEGAIIVYGLALKN